MLQAYKNTYKETLKEALKENFKNITFIKSFNYQNIIPPFLREYIRRFIGFSNNNQKELIYNFELTNFLDKELTRNKPIWKDSKKCAFITTHDIDTAYGQSYIENFFKIEEDLNIKSTNFWVTHLYKLDHKLLTEIYKNGFEIALHDYNHDGKLAMLTSNEIKKRIESSKDFMNEYSVMGIRSPNFLRSTTFYQAIKDIFSYDMSIIDYSFLFPFPSDGCRTSFPFYFENLLLLPNSLLRDGEALALGLKPKEILNAWISKYNWLKSKNSLIVLLTHPDKGFSNSNEMLSIYKTFLEYVKSDNECWHTNAKELCNFLQSKKQELICLSSSNN